MIAYRKEIDGLRAIAIIPVILFHAGFEWFNGGYLGVDIFFVISGYLITSIILSEIRKGQFSLLNFYERRARRILPALYLAMLCCLPAAWLILLPHQLKDFGQSLIATSTFLSNILFWLESGYFEALSDLKPLLHTWSLAIEEQFYFIFPLLVLIFIRLGWKSLFLIISLITILSFVFGKQLYPNDEYASFYLLPTRIWELMIGALCGLYLQYQKTPKANNILSSLGLLLIIISVFIFDKQTAFPSLISTTPLVGTVFIILFAHSNNFIARLLSLRFLVIIGLLSYSAYLIHQPVLAFTKVALNTELSLLVKYFIVATTFGLSFISFKFIETPFRNHTHVSRASIISVSVIGAILFSSVGYSIHKHNGFLDYKLSQIPKTDQRYIVNLKKEIAAKNSLKSKARLSSYLPFDLSSDNKKILILGDSVSYDLYLAVTENKALFPNIEFRHQRLDDACLKYLNLEKMPDSASNECKYYIYRLHKLKQYQHADVIAFSAVWQQHTYSDTIEALHFFKKDNRTLLFIGSANFNDVSSLSYKIAKRSIKRENFGQLFARNQRQDWKKQNANLQSFLQDKEGTFLSKYDVFCKNNQAKTSCELYDKNDQPLIYDTGHVTVAGVYYYGRRVYELGWFN